MTRWFRMYDDLLDDPKVQRLDPVLFKTWVNLLCLASRHDGILPPLSDVAFALRIDEAVALSRLVELADKELLDTVSHETFSPHNWDTRQFKSDTSTERSQKHRAAQAQRHMQQECNVAETVEATPPDTDTDTDTERKVLSEKVSDVKPVRRKIAYSQPFETFWKAYPTDPGMSKAEAWPAWERLSVEDQAKAIAAIPAFKIWIKKQGADYRTVHTCRYLSKRRFDGFALESETTASGQEPVVIREGTPEWEQHKRDHPRATARTIKTDTGFIQGAYYYPKTNITPEAA